MRMREEQMQAFSDAAVKSFEDRMVVHLLKFFPEQCTALGEPKTRDAIREGIVRASHYDIVAERDVCKFVDLMFAFGRTFDVDSRYPWARKILGSNDDPHTRTEALYQTALRYVWMVAEAG